MLFPKEQEVNRTWRMVVEAVIADRLGPVVKVAPDDGKDERLSGCKRQLYRKVY